MLRKFVGVLLVVLLCVAGVLAADGTVVSYDKDTGKLVVKVGDKERVFELKASTHVHDVDGKEIRAKDRPDKLKKDVKIEIEEKDGKLIEINLKK